MAEIELVIKIPEHYYENNIKKELPIYLSEDNIVAILPKNHGRLIDADALNFNADYYEPLISKLDFDSAPTVIEADTETWNSCHGQVTVPKGTLKQIYEEADDNEHDI